MNLNKILNNFLTLFKNNYIFISIVIFNLLFLFRNILAFSLPPDELIIDWRTLQYFLNYDIEFLKRAFLGHVFYSLEIQPTLRTLWILSIILGNLILMFIIIYLKYYISNTNLKITLLILFVISPATSWNFGYEVPRSDLYNLFIYSTILFIILIYKKNMYLIPFLIVISLLTHEIFLLMFLPTLLIFLYIEMNEYRIFFYFTLTIIVICLLSILIFGSVQTENINQIYYSIYNKEYNLNKITEPFMILTTSILYNVEFTILRYKNIDTWLDIFYILPLFLSYTYIYFIFMNISSYSNFLKLLIFSPFFILPMFFIGVDIFRWFDSILLNMFIVFIYIFSNCKININFNKIKIPFLIIVFYTFLGPLGSNQSLPFVKEIILKIGL